MAYTIQLHIANEEPVVAEVENLPDANATIIVANNPRMRDGKDLRYAAAGVTTIIYPVARIAFIQVLPSGDEEKVISVVRE